MGGHGAPVVQAEQDVGEQATAQADELQGMAEELKRKGNDVFRLIVTTPKTMTL